MAKGRGNLGWVAIAASGTVFDKLEGKTDLSMSYSNGEINATDADNNDSVRFGAYEDYLAGDGEGTITYTGNYTAATAQELLLTSIETGASVVMAWGKTTAGTNPATTDFKTSEALITSVSIKCDAGVQTITATIRINSMPTACAGTETFSSASDVAAGKAIGRTTGGGYIQLVSTAIANMTSITFDFKRSEIDATDADSSAWKNFLYGDFSATITGSCNEAGTTEHMAITAGCRAGTTLAIVYGFRAYVQNGAGKQKYSANAICTKADVKASQTGLRTLDFTFRVKGVPTKTA